MAAKLYTDKERINKTMDWNGDEQTGGLPWSGELVQKFIKDTLAKKFGYMEYDRASNQYWVFADQEDYEAYMADPLANAALRLKTFDAPAPATIEISEASKRVNTILLSEVDSQKISFKYLVKDSGGNVQISDMSVAISIDNNISGVKTVPTQLLKNMSEEAILYEFDNIGDYLSEGTNTISVVVTSLKYNISTTVTFQYKVLNLMLTSDFAIPKTNGQGFWYYNGISMDDNEYFGTTITATGTGPKYLRVFIDGQNIYGSENAYQFIGSNSPQNFDLNLQFRDENGEKKEWATVGKHSFQFYFFVLNEAMEEIKSQTLYYDIVLTESGMQRGSYVLFTRTLDQGELVAEGEQLQLTSEQYESISVDYAIYDTSGRGNNDDGSAVIVDLLLTNTNTGNTVANPQAAIPSGSTATFNYTFDTYGPMNLAIRNTVEGGETVNISVEVKQSSVEIEAASSNLVLELKAINRSNTEPEAKRNIWEYTYTPVGTTVTTSYQAIFNNVLWNNQNGWIDNCLVLNNGATVEIPVNIFGQWNAGLTFEIDFETSNVQDDDATIMRYGSENDAHIFINACNAELQSNKKVNIHTNYKENSRQKIQFIFNGNSFNSNDDALKVESPYLMYIVTNGILDRAAQFTATDGLGTNSPANFTIGNTDGQATIKIHSIRIYRRALTLDECVDNYIADSNAIRVNYLKNDIYAEGSTFQKPVINVNSILNSNIHIPVMTVFGDITNSIVKRFDKKANVPVDILYQDPNHDDLNFFARDAWMSNQGTSSMNYPRRNLRLYFNKKLDDKSLRGYASNDRYNYETRVWWGLTDNTTIEQIQNGTITDLDSPIEVNGKTYTCLFNKKTLKKKAAEIDYETAVMFVHSGIKIYSDKSCEKSTQIKKLKKYREDNPEGKIFTQGAYARFKDGKNKFDDSEPVSLYTDRWTIKCDYAESSMTHNAGVGRLWNDVMRDVEVGTKGFTFDTKGDIMYISKPCSTNAQRAAQDYDARHATTDGRKFGDIRTSCDGYPIIIVNRPRLKDANGKYTEGYGEPVFLGLYNIMTDKGSTPLFGFEDLKDEEGTIYEAGNESQRTECWECLQNGSALAQMSTVKTDNNDKDGNGAIATTNDARLLADSYEPRWPDGWNGHDYGETLTNQLETLIRFVNFCKDAVDVKVGEIGNQRDGYTLSDFSMVGEPGNPDIERLEYYAEHLDEVPNNTLYLGVPSTDYKDKSDKFYRKDDSGAIVKDDDGKAILLDPSIPEEKAKIISAIGSNVYYYQTYDTQNVTGKSFGALWNENNEITIDAKVDLIIGQLSSDAPQVFIAVENTDPDQIDYVPYVYDPSISGYNWYVYDDSYKRDVITKTISTEKLKDEVYIGKVYTFDGKRIDSEGQQLYPNAWVNVYLTKNGNKYTYTNEFGEANTPYASGEDVIEDKCSGYVGTLNDTFKGKTLMDYFKDKKYEHFDVWKLAAYYVYIMRFAAVDQVIKNTMMTTEDGKHYYFINYDNDTILGVRNDGYLAYDWQITRESYDFSIGAYCYAGFGSVLWNLLEQDDDFMDKVKTVATAMVQSNVLTYDIALDMFNNKQAGIWSERLYNNSEMYKYIGTFNDLDNRGTASYNPYTNAKYLPFLHGSRASHRDWWLRHRFDLFDAKWGAGEYADAFIQVYYNITASPSNARNLFTMKAASKFYFTVQDVHHYTLNNNFIELERGKTWTPQTQSSLAGVSDPIMILGGYNMEVIDFSENRQAIGASGITFNDNFKNYTCRIKELILGGDKTSDEKTACACGVINNLGYLVSLETLDIRTCENLTTVDISNLSNLKKFLASESGITNFLPAQGLILEEVSLPGTIQNIVLKNITFAQPTEEEIEDGITTKFNYSPNTALTHVEILDCEGIDIIDFLNTWYKDLKAWNVMMTNYSCVLSFERIELPAEIDGVDSLVWLNNIRKEFGKNTNGEDNFVIKKGIIKLYGHAIDDISGEPTGGLTQDDYTEILKYWPEEFFRPDNAAQFDANKSLFITVKSSSPRFAIQDPNYGNDKLNPYLLVSGQSVDINVTIFPKDNERTIKLIPKTLNPVTNKYVSTGWSDAGTNGARYTNNFGIFGSTTSLTNDNGSSKLIAGEYSDGSRKNICLTIQDSKDPQNTSNNIYFEILDIVLPNGLEIYDIEKENPITNQTQEITNINKEYIYRIEFTNPDDVNVDIKSIGATFGNTTISESENGKLSAYVDEEDGNMYVKYLPKINRGDSENALINVYVNITMNDVQSTVITRNRIIPIILKTNNITSISLEYNGTEVTNVDGRYVIDNYIRTINGQSQIVYHYDVKVNPEDFNVIIKSMEIVGDTASGFCTIENIEKNNPNDVNAITGFDITCDVRRKRTMMEGGEISINLVATDSNNNTIATIEQPIDWSISCFYPDEIKLIKKENGVESADYINVDLLNNEDSKAINYEVHIYSRVGQDLYYWSPNTADTATNDCISTHYLYIGQYPIYEHDNEVSVVEDPDDGQIAMVITNSQITKAGNKFSFTTIKEGSPITVNFNVQYGVVFNTVACTLNTTFSISKSAAVAAQGNWQNLPADNFYYMDKELRFYTAANLGLVENLDPDHPENTIAAVVYRYDDAETNKRIVSVDPWQLKAKKTLKWWEENSSFNTHEAARGMYAFGNYNDPNPENFYNLFFECSGLSRYTNYDDLSYNQRFECMYNYYAFISVIAANSNPIVDGGTFEIVNTTTNRPVNIPASPNIMELAHKLESREYTIGRKTCTNSDMIFNVYDYYRNNYQMNVNGRILSGDEIAIVYSLRDEFAEAIQKVDPRTTVAAWEKILIDDEAMFIISNPEQCDSYNQANPGNTTITRPASTFTDDAANYKYSKWFACNDTLEFYANPRSVPNTDVYVDRSYNEGTLSVAGTIHTETFRGRDVISAHFKLYYIATPCI